MISIFSYLLFIIVMMTVLYVYFRLSYNKIKFFEGEKEKRDFELRELQNTLEDTIAKLDALINENQKISTEKDRVYLELKALKIEYETFKKGLERKGMQRGDDDIIIEYYASEKE